MLVCLFISRYFSLFFFPCFESFQILHFSLTLSLTPSRHHQISLCLPGFLFHSIGLHELLSKTSIKSFPLTYRHSLLILSSCSFSIFFLHTNFLLVSFTFLILWSHNNCLSQLIQSLVGMTFMRSTDFLWYLLTKQ